MKSGNKIGLALGGGGARGMAHLGVLTVLLEAGITVDCVAGCSAGAILGAVYCAGMPLEQIHSLAAHVRWRRLASPSRSRRGLLTLDKLERWLVMLIDEVNFAELSIPLAVVTVDTVTGQRVVLREGSVANAVRASCSVPGFVEPVPVGDQLLADGGIIDNVPVNAARELGADFVIGVDIFEPSYKPRLGPFGAGLMAVETMVRNAGGGCQAADFLVTPQLGGQTYVRFSQQQRLISLGEQAARQSLDQLLIALAED